MLQGRKSSSELDVQVQRSEGYGAYGVELRTLSGLQGL